MITGGLGWPDVLYQGYHHSNLLSIYCSQIGSFYQSDQRNPRQGRLSSSVWSRSACSDGNTIVKQVFRKTLWSGWRWERRRQSIIQSVLQAWTLTSCIIQQDNQEGLTWSHQG